MLTSEYDDDSLLNVAADQSEELLRLHQLQLKFKNRELVDTRNELAHQRSVFEQEKIELEKHHREDTNSLRQRINDLQDTLRIRDTELATTQRTLTVRSNDLETARNKMLFAQKTTREAEQKAYEAKEKYKALGEDLSRQHKKSALAFQEQLTRAFEKKVQKIKLKHTQDVFLAKKIVQQPRSSGSGGSGKLGKGRKGQLKK